MRLSNMRLSMVLPKPNKRGAVFTTYFLIALAMVLSRLIPNTIPKDQSYLNYILAASFFLVSGGTVKYMVEGAIDDAADDVAGKQIGEKLEQVTKEYGQEISGLKAELEKCKRDLPDSFYKRQVQEYKIAILRARELNDFEASVMRDPDLSEVEKDILARKSIARRLSGEGDKFLLRISTKACREVWGLQSASKEELKKNSKLRIFRQNIYVYLKAWLMLSIENNRCMPLSPVLPELPDKNSFTIDDQINALTFIKEQLIDQDSLNKYFEDDYREMARSLLKTNLATLISDLSDHRNQLAP